MQEPQLVVDEMENLMRWYADNLVAPELSLLNICNAPYVHELPNYHGFLVLNQATVSIYKEPVKVLLLNFVRRLASATSEYRSGREHLMLYISSVSDHSKLGNYNSALAHFEDCILNGHIAIVCLNGVGKYLRRTDPSVSTVYKARGGSDYDRLRELNNRIKHFDEDIEEAISNGSPIPVAPIWITNSGLKSSTVSLSFVELAEILTTQAEDAKGFSEHLFAEVAESR